MEEERQPILDGGGVTVIGVNDTQESYSVVFWAACWPRDGLITSSRKVYNNTTRTAAPLFVLFRHQVDEPSIVKAHVPRSVMDALRVSSLSSAVCVASFPVEIAIVFPKKKEKKNPETIEEKEDDECP